MMWTQEFSWQGYPFSLNMEPSSAVQRIEPNTPPAPGAGAVIFTRLALSSTQTTSADAVALEAEIRGSHIARLFLEVFWEGPHGWLAGPVFQKELSAPATREIGGVLRPHWDENNLLSVAWQPQMHLMVSGTHAAWVFLQPALNLINNSLQAYQLPANIQPKHGTTRYVRLIFTENGTLHRVAALGKQPGQPGRTRGITIHAGDQVTPVFSWMRQNNQANTLEILGGYTQQIPVEDSLPHLESAPALPGRYQVGILALDMDGQPQRAGIPLEII